MTENLSPFNHFLLFTASAYTIAPHTPQQNGVSERRHRHIVETGKALLTYASLLFDFHFLFRIFHILFSSKVWICSSFLRVFNYIHFS